MPDSPRELRHPRSEVGLAELVQALHHLRPTDSKTRDVISAALGFAPPNAADEIDSEIEPRPDDQEINGATSDPGVLVDSTEVEVPAEGEPERARLEMLDPVRVETVTVEQLFGAPIPKDIDALDSSTAAEPPPERLSLLRPHWFRGVAGAMLATSQPSRDIDWQFLERRLVRGLPIEKLPWQPRPTLKRGVQVLLDQSESMQPFSRDGIDLITRLRRLIGQRSVRTWSFQLDPWRPAASQWKWISSASQSFTADTPLLIVSDFGIARGARGAEPWQEIVRRAEQRRCPLVALIPAPQPSWPEWLPQIVPNAFVWDQETSPQIVRRALLRIH
jgi:hypothetical protein